MTKAENIILACDESGAKGYADQQEAYPGEVGVFAGIMIPEERQSTAYSELQEVFLRYRPPAGKLHIANLPPGDQQHLRSAVYDSIRKLNLPCFWYAIHVQGLNAWYLEQKSLHEEARRRAHELNPSPRIRTGSPRDEIPSMHEELFAGLYAHLIAFLEERCRKRVAIEVRTDQIDSPIVKNFEESSRQLLEKYPHVHSISGWDTLTKKKVETRIEFDTPDTSQIDIKIEVEKLTINPIALGDGYTLAADVLANSINHLFRNRVETQLYTPLNEPGAILQHPLADYLATFHNWGNGDIIGDRLYRHPRSQH